MFGTSLFAALASAVQDLVMDGILSWITEILNTIFPHA